MALVISLWSVAKVNTGTSGLSFVLLAVLVGTPCSYPMFQDWRSIRIKATETKTVTLGYEPVTESCSARFFWQGASILRMMACRSPSATHCEAFPMTAPSETTSRMMMLQKARITTVIKLTQENAMVLSLQQRVGGKEIEMMVVERANDLAAQLGEAVPEPSVVDAELGALRVLLEYHVTAVLSMEEELKRIDGNIAALRQS